MAIWLGRKRCGLVRPHQSIAVIGRATENLALCTSLHQPNILDINNCFYIQATTFFPLCVGAPFDYLH
jgi:hypothetical protein